MKTLVVCGQFCCLSVQNPWVSLQDTDLGREPRFAIEELPVQKIYALEQAYGEHQCSRTYSISHVRTSTQSIYSLCAYLNRLLTLSLAAHFQCVRGFPATRELRLGTVPGTSQCLRISYQIFSGIDPKSCNSHVFIILVEAENCTERGSSIRKWGHSELNSCEVGEKTEAGSRWTRVCTIERIYTISNSNRAHSFFWK
jgi:hypothetical protein